MASRFDGIAGTLYRSSNRQRPSSDSLATYNVKSRKDPANSAAWDEQLKNLKSDEYKIPYYLKLTSYAETIDQFMHSINKDSEDAFSRTAQSIGSDSERERTQLLPESLWPLPSKWNDANKSVLLEVSKSGKDIAFVGPGRGSDSDAASLRADFPMSPQCGIYYFEIRILSKGKSGFIGIGFCKKTVPLNRLPGWEPDSWGYHGDDGHSFCCKGTGKPYASKYSTGDIIGCGVDFQTNTAFYTKNGIFLGEAFKEISGELFPSVGLRTLGESVSSNFGENEFIFDIERYIRTKKQAFFSSIMASSKLDRSYIDKKSSYLVENYLRHNGHIKSLKSFIQEQDELRKMFQTEESSSKEDVALIDTNAYRRQKIRDAMMLGNIDEAIELTKLWYPKALTEDFEILFKLKCQKFVELIRNSLKSHSSDENESSNDDMDTLSDPVHRKGHNFKSQGKLSVEEQLEMKKCLDYGRTLYAEYKDTVNDSLKKYLNETVSLLLFSDSSQLPMGSVINDSERRILTEKLIAAIYKSEGQSAASQLERLTKHTKVSYSRLRSLGYPQAAFVNFQTDLQQ